MFVEALARLLGGFVLFEGVANDGSDDGAAGDGGDTDRG